MTLNEPVSDAALPVSDNRPEGALCLERLSKTFGGEHALRQVDLEVRPGEVHALIGTNGSGKSTLIKILAGFHQPDPGARASIGGRPLSLGDASEVESNGIRFVHQELGLIGNMDAVDNFGLGRGFLVSGGRIHWRSERRRVNALLSRLGVDIDVRAPVDSLSLAERTMIAIARAIDVSEGDVRFLILDEPTASLGGPDAQRLFDVVERIRAEGVGVVIVSHHLDEVLGVADRITVLRDGDLVGTFQKSTLDRARLIQLMTGHEPIDAAELNASPPRHGKPVLSVRNLRGAVLDQVDLDLWPGEILGVVGLFGSGIEEFQPLLLGLKDFASGTIEVERAKLQRMTPRRARRHGIWAVSGDRGKYGVFPSFAVYENISISDLRPFVNAGVLRRKSERAGVDKWMETFAIQASSSSANIMSLSGGNQQKAVLAKVLRARPKVLILDDPTRGVDVPAKEEIHRVMDQVATEGTAILLCSSDHEEVTRLCDRTLVLRKGSVVKELSRSEYDANGLGHLVI